MKALEPVIQAVSLEDYKRSVHILPDDNLDDVLFDSYLMSAQDVVETAARRPMTPRSVRFQERLVGAARWWMPVCPIAALTSIHVTDAAGAQVVLPVGDLRLELPDDEPQVVFPDRFWVDAVPGAVVTIVATVGYEAIHLPRQLREAVTLIVKDWYDAKIAVDKTEYTAVSFGCKALIRQVKYARPHTVDWAAS